MPTVYKVLGQSAPSAATATTLYTVPSATSSIVSSINVANTSSTGDFIRIAIRPAGATLANQHYQAFGLQIPPASVYTWTTGATLATTDVITIYSTNGTCSFSAFGSEIS
jgi:glucose-6-phosphate dehydrogenase assembly protein OpcA